jgi:uncharacterized membrane protein
MKHPEALNAIWRGIAVILEGAGVAAIIIGALLAAVLFVRRSMGEGNKKTAYQQFRSDFGKAILLGLEFLVAADIVGTVAVGATLPDLAVLGTLVLIRTFLSFTLKVEISGHWPWQREPGPKAD